MGCCCYLVSLNHSTFHIFTDAFNCLEVKGGSCWPGDVWRCNDGKCWCTVMQHFSMGQFCTCNTPHHWRAAAEVSGSRKLPVIPCWFNSPGLELVKYSMYRCFKKHISGACPALDMLTPGREHSPLSLTSHLFPGQKKSNIHHVLNVLNIVCSTFSSTRGMN